MTSLSIATAAAKAAGARPVLIGVDIGGTNVHAGIVGLEGELLATNVTPIGEDFAVEAVVLKIVGAVKEALATAAADLASGSGAGAGSQIRAIGVGVGVPGVCDFPKGVSLWCCSLVPPRAALLSTLTTLVQHLPTTRSCAGWPTSRSGRTSHSRV